MADFKAAIPYILENEGGYAHDSSDSGGETYRGISRVNFPNWSGWNIIDDHKPLGHGETLKIVELDSAVNNFYYKQFWCALRGDQIENQSVATYLLDSFVNCGHYAVKWAQKVCGVTVDGIFGSATLGALNAKGDILSDLHTCRTEYYYGIGHGIDARFLNGWISRANDLFEKLKLSI